MSRQMWIYILASPSRVLYIGVTNNMRRRWFEHQAEDSDSFACRYSTRRLVYVEPISGQREAIAREKTLKGWKRLRKLKLIEATNPEWNDLAEEWGWTR